jgi:peptidoglycan/xylan/chitin deacetylase (PgdA/CDA1 family)
VPTPRLALKVDVDTERGTRFGVPALAQTLLQAGAPATFYFSLGPDNTGRALRRVFRRGFLRKVARTNVLALYGPRTLLNGVLWPGPRIARRHAGVLRAVRDAGFEVGVHCWDHVRWQDRLHEMSAEETERELGRALEAFREVFGAPATTAGAAGWQANAHSLAVYDAAGLAYASDARGRSPFFPRCDGRVFRTLQIPTTLPTLDEVMGDPDHPEAHLVEDYLGWLRTDALNVMTLHAEIEGMRKRDWFGAFLRACRSAGVEVVRLDEEARRLLADRDAVAVAELTRGVVPGRSGTLAVQGEGTGVELSSSARPSLTGRESSQN